MTRREKIPTPQNFSGHSSVTRRRKISTDYDIIQTIITNDEKHAIILLVVSLQQEYEIQIFQLNFFTRTHKGLQSPINQITITGIGTRTGAGTQVYADVAGLREDLHQVEGLEEFAVS